MIRVAASKMSCRLCEIRTTREPLLGEALDEREHLLGLRDAERGGRLVEDHELRVPHHRARDGDRLPLTAGERRDRLADRADRRHARASSASRSSSPPSAAPSAAGTSRAPRGRGTCSGRRRGCRRARDPGRRPRSRASPRPSGCGSRPARPSKKISPSSIGWMPATHLISVDLPAPLSPTSAITSPCAHLEVDVGQRLHGAERLGDSAKLEKGRRRSRGVSHTTERRRRPPGAPPSICYERAVLAVLRVLAAADVALLQEDRP